MIVFSVLSLSPGGIMKTVVPSATLRAMYDRAVSTQAALEHWVGYLAKLNAEQSPPAEKSRFGWSVQKKPESITVPYREFEQLLYALHHHSGELKKFRKPVVQRPKL